MLNMDSNLLFILLHLKFSNDKKVIIVSIPFASIADSRGVFLTSFLTVTLAPFSIANSVASTRFLDVA